MNYEIGLYHHNASAYEKVKEEFKESDKACIVHATGTGKSFIALQLIYDFVKDNPNRKVVYLTPLLGIQDQLQEHLDSIEKHNKEYGIEFHREYFDNVKFITYARAGNNVPGDLDSISREELSHLKADMMILDEFHHIGKGADNWKAGINLIQNANPNMKIFGMSATSVRNRRTSKEEDVAEIFFEGHKASEYPLEQAIADGVLPAPNYHAAYSFLTEECEELESKVKDGKASEEEKKEYKKVLKSIKEKISELENQEVTDLVKNYIKPNEKYIYFCAKDTDIEELQNNFLEMLPEELRGNVEFYQVHSSEYTSKENKSNAYNFYNNVSANGESSNGKLRVMFAINMYNEGIHVPDIDGVIMGRSTKSEIIYYQQLGRALAVKKKSENDETPIESPLVLDLQNNFRRILKLYKKVEKRENHTNHDNTNDEDNKGKNNTTKNLPLQFGIDGDNKRKNNTTKNLLLQFGIDEEIINIVDELDKVKQEINERERKLTPEDYVDLIEQFCEHHNVWPSQAKDVINLGIEGYTGYQLANWLNYSGYNTNNFKYSKELKDKLYNLDSKYAKKKVEPEDYVDLIEQFCEHHNVWPSQAKDVINLEIEGYTGYQLAFWLAKSGYNTNNFKYSKELKDKLVNLYNKYYISPEGQMVNIIEQFCELHNVWPSQAKDVINLKIEGYTGRQLAFWLAKSGYNTNNFKYSKELKDKLVNLYNKYYISPEGQMVNIIEQFCEHHNVWPSRAKDVINLEIEGYTGRQLASWLDYSGYNNYKKGKGDFKCSDELRDRLDALYGMYYGKKLENLEAAKSEVPNEQAFNDAQAKLNSSKPKKNKKGVNNGKQI